ncbi:alpha/beta hydrolase family protein [Lysinibacillus odysseyi]|uniref:Peptidase n=1 Tax=Lysinibacillus odysseyi 34hs-1 = NBRC 100172 TaxID=1220589 RepID=A0A0A3IQ99_9BACI|nr:S9 family peptidase [Lysinibacillus odysseyi]KGR85043.1 peptidase [Lysinibacillus odysseyi 34hs-1 = NBRC 100172]
MKKKWLPFVFSAALLAMPMSAFANESAPAVVETKQSRVTVAAFLEQAVTELTYQHGSDYMREEVLEKWLGGYNFEDETAPVSQGEAALILIKALGLEQGEQTPADYKKSAAQLGFFEGVSSIAPITETEMQKLFANVEKYQNKAIDDKGVPEISVEDFMKNPGDVGYQLSPDGNYISYASAWENRLNVFVKAMGNESAPTRVTSTKDRDIAGFFWKDDSILYLKDNGGDENYHIYSSSFNGAEEKDLTPYEGVAVLPLDNLKNVKDEILVTMNKEDATVFDVYKLNIKTGETHLVAKNPGSIQSWISDSNGEIRMAVESDGYEGNVLYRETEKDEFKPFITIEAGDTVSPIAFSQDNQFIYALSDKGRDKIQLVKYDLDGKEEVILSNPNVDISNALYSSSKDKLLYSAYITDKVHYEFFDDEFEAVFNKMKDKLGVDESELGINDYNKEMTKFIVSVGSDTVFGKYYYYDSETDTVTQLAELSPWLDEANMAQMHSISYKSRDGLTIHGYLTLPKNKKAENLPMVVIPHGGPWARDVWGFNPEVQLLANRGYAVLQMNFRSSTGYGKEFVDAGNKQWGLKIQDDITDGVQWAIDQGIANPEKIGIYGASFGGYATLAGITFTPDLYAAAVDYVGVSNIFTLLDTVPPYWETMLNMFHVRVGHPEKDKELLKSVSPVFHADKIKTPLFVAQGANDPRVNKQESDQIVEALKKRGVDVEYMVKENEGHGFMNEENKIEFYNAMTEFLDKHLK